MRSGLVRSLVFWYAVIVFATFGVLNLTVSGIIEANNEKILRKNFWATGRAARCSCLAMS